MSIDFPDFSLATSISDLPSLVQNSAGVIGLGLATFVVAKAVNKIGHMVIGLAIPSVNTDPKSFGSQAIQAFSTAAATALGCYFAPQALITAFSVQQVFEMVIGSVALGLLLRGLSGKNYEWMYAGAFGALLGSSLRIWVVIGSAALRAVEGAFKDKPYTIFS